MNTKTSIMNFSVPENATFLILEDMPNLREQMITDLRSIGVKGQIHEAEDVQSALVKAKNEKIEFFISDWNLPDGTGFQFLMKVRESMRYKNTPFIMCTTMDDISNILQAVKAGADEYLVKPWDVKDLKTKVAHTWKKYHP